MRRRGWGFVLAIVAMSLLTTFPSHGASAEPASKPTSKFEALQLRLQAALDTWAASPKHRGVSAAVILADGQEWVGTGGIEATGAPLEPEHLIWIASITKTMTGAVILQLAEAGALSLDDTVARWIDPVPVNVNPKITIRQLLNHTNGLANYTRNPGLNDALREDAAHVFSTRELLKYVGAPVFEPGERTQYTNTSFVLLGLIAEAAGGKPMATQYQERLWGPLKLDAIFLPGRQKEKTPVATAWAGRNAENAVAPLERMALLSLGNTAFGLFSNATTVARWGRALFTGRVFDAAMHKEMVSFASAAGNIPGETGAGLGIRAYDYNDGKQWGHSGGSPLGSSLLLYDVSSGITVAVIMNQGRGAEHFVLAPELLSIAQQSEAASR